MYKSLLAILFSLTSSVWSEGFVDGTPVKTPDGYENISQLKAGDLVLSCDFKNHCVEREVIKTHQTIANGYLEIKVGKTILKVDEDHLFYDPQTASWIQAKKLLTSSQVMNASYEKLAVKDVRYVSQKVILYTLTVDENHNFMSGTKIY